MALFGKVQTGEPLGVRVVTLSMTLKELERLQRLAQRKGQTVDDYVRDLVRRVVR